MIILRIEHRVPDFGGWKRVFDSDPIGRKKFGVRRYCISRQVDDPNYVMIDLEFENLKEAEDTLTALRNLWEDVNGKIIMNPQSRIFEVSEKKRRLSYITPLRNNNSYLTAQRLPLLQLIRDVA